MYGLCIGGRNHQPEAVAKLRRAQPAPPGKQLCQWQARRIPTRDHQHQQPSTDPEQLRCRQAQVCKCPWILLDIDRAEQELGWRPTVRKQEGVRRLFEWVAANRELFDSA